MKTHRIPAYILIAFTLGVLTVHQAHAETTINDTYAQIEALTVKIAELQKQLLKLTQEVRTVLKDGLAEGVTDSDVERIQKLLATNSAIYPEGKVTGFFGPLTKEALKRFQKHHGIIEDGTLNKETRVLLEKYLKENKGVPKTIVKTGDVRIQNVDGDAFTCVKDIESGKIICSPKDANAEKKHSEDLNIQQKADAAIQSAEDAIEKAEEAIDEAHGETDAAEEYLSKATYKLDMATDLFDAKKYTDAKALAYTAMEYAAKAVLKLE